MSNADFGLVGLAVMGENLVLNMESRGFRVAVFNRTTTRVDEFIKGRGAGKNLVGTHSLKELVAALKKPRRVMIMVKAGGAVDAVLDELVPLLEAGDIVIDGGNTHFPDTDRREKRLRDKGLYFIGAGVSGGEEGALTGPSIMPGGAKEAWPAVAPVFQAIAAKVDGAPCCEWIGPAGSGHYVKMVHNGIEYGDMQLIGEAYHLLSSLGGLDAKALAGVFGRYDEGPLDSYLIEVTRDVFGTVDPETGKPLVDLILDVAGQKGTGKWTVGSAADLGIPLTLIGEAVFARCISAQKDERVRASERLAGPKPSRVDAAELEKHVEQALYAAKIVSYAQGFALLRAMAKDSKWPLDYGSIAMMWRGGCIIRSAFLGKIKEAFEKNADLENLMLDEFFQGALARAQEGWRRVLGLAVQNGIPTPAMSAALAYYDAYRTARLPANLLQAQRDFFGAHTYERTDKARGQFFHTNWTGHGGTTSSTTYNA
ncbi:MAG: decarboxylating NADP(+)-dependent phosphogluconate dehydrogenase [Myxococcales bacterium]|nr:decarboxylating NADP(+)-dependent phosphogluconate dehydrogenase [Myxococcales bacterium]